MGKATGLRQERGLRRRWQLAGEEEVKEPSLAGGLLWTLLPSGILLVDLFAMGARAMRECIGTMSPRVNVYYGQGQMPQTHENRQAKPPFCSEG